MSDLSDRREARRFAMNLPVRVLVNDANGPELKRATSVIAACIFLPKRRLRRATKSISS
jgi:hypothetical protein